MEAAFTLPYPTGLSVNQYWRWTPKGVFLSSRAKQYRNEVAVYTRYIRFAAAKIKVSIKIYPPTHNYMDIDNCLKVVLDAMQSAHVYIDDNQIFKLLIERMEVIKKGKLDIVIKSCES